ncbi:PAS domain S-box protein [Sesbania bispinosa]|nr:PAS domain S-box protein [Sesbania bispinosa]
MSSSPSLPPSHHEVPFVSHEAGSTPHYPMKPPVPGYTLTEARQDRHKPFYISHCRFAARRRGRWRYLAQVAGLRKRCRHVKVAVALARPEGGQRRHNHRRTESIGTTRRECRGMRLLGFRSSKKRSKRRAKYPTVNQNHDSD